MLQLVLEFIVRAALIAAVTAAVLRVMKVRSAAARHAVWAGVVVVMLLLPVWLAWGPKAYLRVLPKVTNQPAVATAPKMLVNLIAMPRAAASPSRTHPAPRWPKLALGLYLFGLGVLLARLTVGTARAHGLARRADNRAGVLTSASCAAPVTVGWLHPVVILPEHWMDWSPAQIKAVWTHELEHAHRRDPLVQWLALFNRAVFWFHPIAWWIERELSALAEEACDTAVLESGHDPREYSECLLRMARLVMQAGARVNVGMAMPGSFLSRRIRKILEGGRVPRASRARMACAVTACAVMSATLAAGTLAYAPQREPLRREPPRQFAGPIAPHVLLAQSHSRPAAQAPPEMNRRPDAVDFLLGPRDQLLVQVPQAAEIDGHPFRIDAGGNIDLPLLGRVHAGGMTIRELERDLIQRLREHVREPRVFITVVQFHAPPSVYFVGAFNAPGTYPMQGSGKLSEMLTAAGGLRPDAGRYIKITRQPMYGPIVEMRVDRLRKTVNPAEDILLQPLDVVSVEPAAGRPAVH